MSIEVDRSKQKNIMVILVYRPPKGNVNHFIEIIRNYLAKYYDDNIW